MDNASSNLLNQMTGANSLEQRTHLRNSSQLIKGTNITISGIDNGELYPSTDHYEQIAASRIGRTSLPE